MAGSSVTPDGVNPSVRVEPTTDRMLQAKVVDNVLTSNTYASRALGMGAPMNGKTWDIPIKVTDSGLGQFFSGLTTLSSSASDTLIELSYAHTIFAQPVVSIMDESFANTGTQQVIDLDEYKFEEAVGEATAQLGTAIFGTGSGSQPLGLEAHVDDGTNAGTIGGQSRTTYSVLDSTVTASGGTLTLAKMSTLDSTVSAAGMANESPNIGVTTKTVWDLYESLLSPQLRNQYTINGGNVLPIRGNQIASRRDAGATGGFTALTFRGFPIIADDKATSGVLYFLNERYLQWRGRTTVPARYAGQLSKVNLGEADTTEGVMAAQPPTANGWFFQDYQVMPNQAGMIARFYVIGQLVGSQPRRHGKLTGVTGV